jgi:hypothetical protein
MCPVGTVGTCGRRRLAPGSISRLISWPEAFLQADGGGPEGVQGLGVAAAVFLLQELVDEVDR